MNKEEEKLEKLNEAMNALTDKCAEFISQNGTGEFVDIEQFIVKLILSFDLNFYEAVGILEEAKNSYRDIMLKENKEEEDD